MILRPDQLDAHLERQMALLYCITGDEPLLVIEAVDAIRRRARADHFTERETLVTDRSFRWSRLKEASSSMSLFGDRKILELRIPTGKPGTEGSQALIDHAGNQHDGLMTIIILPRLDQRSKSTAWFSALTEAGVHVEIANVERDRLSGWIQQRLSKQGQSAPRAALEFIADRVEGNLLAAHQEVMKLGLLYEPRLLQEEEIQQAVLNVARYDVFKLNEAMLGGDLKRLTRMLDGLRAEGESPVLIHWAMTEEIRSLTKVSEGLQQGRPLSTLLREFRIWGPREKLYGRAMTRLANRPLKAMLRRAASIEQLAKGLRLSTGQHNVWDELLRLGTDIAT